jgi:hypothetical protein
LVIKITIKHEKGDPMKFSDNPKYPPKKNLAKTPRTPSKDIGHNPKDPLKRIWLKPQGPPPWISNNCGSMKNVSVSKDPP